MPQDTTEHEDAVEWIRAKSDAGFLWLVGNIGPRVKGMLVHRFGAGGDDTYETAIVEAAETLWLRGEPYDPERGSMVTWLYTAASRICINLFRAEQARPLIAAMPGLVLATIHDDGDSTRTRSDRIAIMLEDLKECIAQLTPREREIVLASLRGFGGTDAELGEELGTSNNVIRVTRSRAHRKLAKLMRRMHGDA
jgi:RNA polymerase sigma factor (sigma-70 family)